MRTVRFLGKEIPRASVEKALYSAAGFLVLFNALTVPFALPKLRMYLGAPYLPSSTSAFRSVLQSIPELKRDGLRLVDIGSGDGRLVMEASRMGIQSMGIEVNPWLVLASRLRLRMNRAHSPIMWGNAWKSLPELELFQPDVLTFYGRPGQGVMTQFGQMAETLSDRTGKEMFVVSNKFQIPGWNIRLVAQVEGFFIYRLHSNRG